MATTNSTSLTSTERRALLNGLKSTRIDLDSPDSVRYFRGVIYGEPGCGKTVFATRFGQPDKRTVILDNENSSEVLKESRHKALREKCDPYPFPGIRETQELLSIFEEDDDVDTVIVDSFITATFAEMKDIIKTAGFNRPDKLGELFAQQDYGLVLNRWISLIDAALNTKLNFILICHARDPDKTEILNGQRQKKLAGTDNQVEAITSRLGNVLFLQAQTDEKTDVVTRRVLARSTQNTFAKNRMESKSLMSDDEFINFFNNWRHGN